MASELEFLLSILRDHPKLFALIAGISCVSHGLTFLADSKATFHRIASVLRWAANILDRAPKVAVDLKAGDIPLAIKDAQSDIPTAHL